MKPQVVPSLLFSLLVGFSAASFIKVPAPRDQSASTEDLDTRTPKSQPVYQPITTTVAPTTSNKSTSLIRKSEQDTRCRKPPHNVVKRQDGLPHAGSGAGAGPETGTGTGGQQEQGQQPEKQKPTHDPLPTLAPSDGNSDSGGGGNGAQIGAIIGGVLAGIIGLALVWCVIKGRKARREAQEDDDEEYEMRRQRRRGRR